MVFLKKNVDRLERITRQLQSPLKDAAAVNATRWALYNALKGIGLPVATGSGRRTKFNRHRLSIPKTHALDAICVGNMDAITAVSNWQQPAILIACTGRGAYIPASGFHSGYLMRAKSVHGFQTGDMVKAVVPIGKKAGSYVGRVAVRASGSFNLQIGLATVQGVSSKYCRRVQRNDGYSYSLIAHSD